MNPEEPGMSEGSYYEKPVLLDRDKHRLVIG